MQYIHVALALHSAGKKVTVANIEKMLSAVGAKTDEGQIKALVAVLDDVDIDEAVKSAPVGMMASASAASVDTPTKTKAKEEVEEEKEESGDDMGLDSLFG